MSVYSWQSIRIRTRIRSNKEITIRILIYAIITIITVQFTDICKISIRGHISDSAHLWRQRRLFQYFSFYANFVCKCRSRNELLKLFECESGVRVNW